MTETSLLIPYGVERWSADYLASGTCRVPHVTVDRATGAPLRLRDGGYDFAEAPALQDLADPAAQLAFLAAHAERHCSLWGKFEKLFLQRYFAFVTAEVEANRQALEARAAAFGGLFGWRDWMFSALRPLPLAHLELPDGSMTRTDFAFWTGDAILALDLAGSATAGPAQQARADALAAAGVALHEMPKPVLSAGDDAFRAALPDALTGFWQHDPVPGGPFVPPGLAEMDLTAS